MKVRAVREDGLAFERLLAETCHVQLERIDTPEPDRAAFEAKMKVRPFCFRVGGLKLTLAGSCKQKVYGETIEVFRRNVQLPKQQEWDDPEQLWEAAKGLE